MSTLTDSRSVLASILGATLVTTAVVVFDPMLAPEAVTAYFGFIGGVAFGRYVVPAPVVPSPSSSSPTGSAAMESTISGEDQGFQVWESRAYHANATNPTPSTLVLSSVAPTASNTTVNLSNGDGSQPIGNRS